MERSVMRKLLPNEKYEQLLFFFQNRITFALKKDENRFEKLKKIK